MGVEGQRPSGFVAVHSLSQAACGWQQSLRNGCGYVVQRLHGHFDGVWPEGEVLAAGGRALRQRGIRPVVAREFKILEMHEGVAAVPLRLPKPKPGGHLEGFEVGLIMRVSERGAAESRKPGGDPGW
jgi:hypothetical protein